MGQIKNHSCSTSQVKNVLLLEVDEILRLSGIQESGFISIHTALRSKHSVSWVPIEGGGQDETLAQTRQMIFIQL